MDVPRLHKKLKKLCEKSKVVGTNIALFNHKEIIYSYNYGFANKEKQIKSNSDSLYMIGSNTKVMTALGILKLQEEGKLHLEDDIRKFIPEFEVKANFPYDRITIKHLLMHRGGLDSDAFHLILDKTRDYHEIIKEVKDMYLTAEPGKMFSYSNVGYTLLGIIIERVSGFSYTEFIQRTIAQPLGIQIHFLLHASDRKPYASNISLCYDKKGRAVEDLLSTLLPAGSNTYMSLNDFVKFGQIFLNKNQTILKKETLEFMEELSIQEEIDDKMQNVGYGLIHNQYDFGEKVGKVLGHGGNTSCHHSNFNYIPDLDVGIVVQTNSEQAITLSGLLANTVLTEYLKAKGFLKQKLSVKHTHVQVDAKKYIGKYTTSLGLLDVQLNRKRELVTQISKIPVKLLACEDGYLQCSPVKILHKLPPFKRSIQGIRWKLVSYFGDEVLVYEQTGKYHKTQGIIGCRYVQTVIPETFQAACGSYQVSNKNFKDLDCQCALKAEDDVLMLEIHALNVKINSCLKVIDENLAITQGFGRNARQAVRLQKGKSGYELTYSGITFEKSGHKVVEIG